MPKKGLTEIVVVVDESGSMHSTADDAIGGFNSFIASQKEIEGEANVTLVLFDDKYQIVYNGLPIDYVSELTNETYIPGGSTALVDAVGKTIDLLSERISSLEEEEKPEKAIVIVITDGYENASKEYKGSDVSKKLKDYQSKEGWEVIFIGASEKILEQADDLGIKKDRMMSYSPSSRGTRSVYDVMDKCLTDYRTKGFYEVPKDAEKYEDKDISDSWI